MRSIRWYGPSIVLALTVAAVMLAGPSVIRGLAHAQRDAHIHLVRNELQTNPLLEELSNAYAGVAEVVEPSVVHIEVASRRAPNQISDWFFGNRGQSRPQPSEMDRFNPPQLSGNGAGWVYDDRGHIITNHHVVSGGDVITVRFSDGSEHTAAVVGADPRTDIAVLRVDADLLHPAVISQRPTRQGEIVFAFGSPFKFDFSMSQGIVSAKGRRLDITDPGGYENFIQTDAEINPGNSGGPLVNIYGEVVGMNTAIASHTGQFAGLGFTIPVQMVGHVADELISQGTVRRGYLGVYIDDLTPAMARTFKFEGRGVLVNHPLADGPADKAGLKSGDIITHIDEQAVESPEALRILVAGYRPGERVAVTVFRDGEVVELEATLTELPGDGMAAAGPGQRAAPEGRGSGEALTRLGIESYETFTPELADQMGWSHVEGVAITKVRRRSLAQLEALIPVSIITHVMGQRVSDVAALEEAIAAADLTKPVRFRVADWNPQQQGYITRFVDVEFPRE